MGSSSYLPASSMGSPGPDDDSLYLYLSDLIPASPSSYLDLPPTPHHDHHHHLPSPDLPAGGADSPTSTPEDLVLPYISRMLMEENIDDKFFYDYPDNAALLEAQKPFLDILSDPSSNSNSNCTSDDTNRAASPCSPSDGSVCTSAITHAAVDSYDRRFHYDPVVDLDPAAFFSAGANADLMNSAFLKGMEEANKFLPTQDKLVIDLEASSANFFKGLDEGTKGAALTVKKEEAVDAVSAISSISSISNSGGGGRGRKNPYRDDELEQEGGRSSKQSAVQGDDVTAREMFDRMLMPSEEMCVEQMQNLRIAMQEAVAKNDAGDGKARGRRGASDVVDLRTLLIHCAQAVATDDRRSATELLKQITLHARPDGDGTQRLAHCFAEGLQARLAGTGGMVHQSLMATRISAVDMLKAYQLYMAAICFKKVSFVFSNTTIYNASLGKKKIHIIDYGIQYGFQWPCFLRRISQREGGPPEVRITGIDLPQPGFRPKERIEETGRRLSKYASEFKVPFKYQAIAAAKMESLRKEDLNIDPEETLIVNCLFQFKNLMDESVVIESPRDIVLSNIRKMRPHTFIHAIVNGSFSAPFFVTRFREVLFYYSALFDVLDTTTPRDNEQRMLIEQNIFGRAALNVIACEGTDRVERPETYRQWQVRNQRAGLKQLPLNPDVIDIVREKASNGYHKDFVIDLDQNWLLQGWKGRILYAISTWAANDASS
ncbi:scarecrow-like protein 34 [Lolium rigidum]|uniref:scarecrow-like protein 34 n=1 Tax=Lolium rigidum TaxID=89674 RepID=UPI001F5E26F0|nr:scarecrow-like protein 34 [Lolium rigidum]